MAAAIKALNARIRANPVTDYICSTHFWGPASNFGIPLAAIMDIQKDPEIISGKMTLALCGYSAVFMRFAMAVTPRNYLLFGCHFVNFTSQSAQAYRFINHWYMGGREKALQAKAQEGLAVAEKKIDGVAGQVKEYAGKAESTAKDLAAQAKTQVERVTR